MQPTQLNRCFQAGRHAAGVLAAAWLCCFNIGTASAALSPMGKEFPLIGDIAGHQQRPQMVMGVNGGFVVWQNESDKSNGEHVMMQPLNVGMVGVGIPIRLSAATDGRLERNPCGALLPDGGVAVAWEAGTRANREIYLRVLAPNFVFLTTEIVANTKQTGDQHDPALTVLADGTIVVLWRSDGQDGSNGGIYGQLFTSQGAKYGAEFRVNQNTQMDQSQPSVTALKGGGFVAAWVSESASGKTSDGAPNLKGNVFGRLFSAQGVATGNEYRLNGTDVVCSEPVLAAMGDGFALAWVQQDEKTMANLGDIFARTFGADGLPLSEGVRLNTWVIGKQSSPSLAASGKEVLVAWQCEVRQTGGYEVHGRLLSGGAEFRANTRVLYHQRQPTVAVDGHGNFGVAWVDYIRDRHAILSVRQFAPTAEQDITAGADVNYEGTAANGVTLAGQVAKPEDPVKTELAGRAAVQQEAVERAVDQQVAQAATVAQAAAGAAATIILRSTAQTATGNEVRTSPMGPVASGMTAGRISTVKAGAASPSQAALSSAAAAKRLTISRTASANTLRNIVSQARTAQPALPSAVTRSGYIEPKGAATGATKTVAVTAATKAVVSRAAASTGSASTTARRTTTAASRLTTVRNTAASSATAARAVPAVQASLTGSGRNMQMQWNTTAGGKYQVQGSVDQQSWQNVGAIRTGAGATDAVPVDAAGNLRFFRVTKTN